MRLFLFQHINMREWERSCNSFVWLMIDSERNVTEWTIQSNPKWHSNGLLLLCSIRRCGYSIFNALSCTNTHNQIRKVHFLCVCVCVNWSLESEELCNSGLLAHSITSAIKIRFSTVSVPRRKWLLAPTISFSTVRLNDFAFIPFTIWIIQFSRNKKTEPMSIKSKFRAKMMRDQQKTIWKEFQIV